MDDTLTAGAMKLEGYYTMNLEIDAGLVKS